MKFAQVDGNKVEAYKGAKGTCPACGSLVIARCGDYKINHWAHKGNRNCDPWWENETEWHREWKNNFPTEWQEIPLTDEQTGEKHIADVRTSHGLVIEFQHLHIDQQERISREKFYKNMVWIVDGTRLKRDYSRFLKGEKYFRNINRPGLFLVDFPDECFPTTWLGSSVYVIFDFRGNESIDDLNDKKNQLYCLYPNSSKDGATFEAVSRESFIKNTISGEWFRKQEEPKKPESPKQNTPPPAQKNVVI